MFLSKFSSASGRTSTRSSRSRPQLGSKSPSILSDKSSSEERREIDLLATDDAPSTLTPLGLLFEDPLDDILAEKGWAKVAGGGTMTLPAGEISYCGIDIEY